MYRRAYEIGDWIRVGETVGEVVGRSLLVTRLRTWKNETVAIPNSQITTMEVANFTDLAKERGLILHANVGIGYEVPWRRVEALLIEAANRTEGLDPDHSPFVLQKALGNFAVTYEINVYCNDPSKMPVLYARLHRNILDVFHEAGVQIMTPNYVVESAEPKIAPPAGVAVSNSAKPSPAE
ncbi:MAG: mechanosensitive ion channel [Alphaproteobacteria bacterium]